jgi:tetratricopeptide (TPR) repeat protein
MQRSVNRYTLIILLVFFWLPVGANNEVLFDLIKQAEEKASEGHYADANALLQQALTENPDSSLAYTRLGGVQLLQQHYREGITSFQQAISYDQANAQAFIGMAIGYLHLGQYNLARAALSEAERLDPDKKTQIDKLLTWLDQRSADRAY